jgi:hypothetical protein
MRQAATVNRLNRLRATSNSHSIVRNCSSKNGAVQSGRALQEMRQVTTVSRLNRLRATVTATVTVRIAGRSVADARHADTLVTRLHGGTSLDCTGVTGSLHTRARPLQSVGWLLT